MRFAKQNEIGGRESGDQFSLADKTFLGDIPNTAREWVVAVMRRLPR